MIFLSPFSSQSSSFFISAIVFAFSQTVLSTLLCSQKHTLDQNLPNARLSYFALCSSTFFSSKKELRFYWCWRFAMFIFIMWHLPLLLFLQITFCSLLHSFLPQKRHTKGRIWAKRTSCASLHTERNLQLNVSQSHTERRTVRLSEETHAGDGRKREEEVAMWWKRWISCVKKET